MSPLPPDVDRAVPGVVISNILCCAIAFPVVAVRIYTRVHVKKAAGWDDLLIIIALLIAIGYAAGEIDQTYRGHYGHHVVYITQEEYEELSVTNVAVNVLNAGGVFFARASICAFIFRLIGSIKMWANVIWFALALNAIVFVGTSVTFGLGCVPIKHTWDPTSPGFCTDRVILDKVVKTFSALNCVVDLICAFVPFAVIRTVQIDSRTKIALYAILCCGVGIASCSIGRLVALDFHSVDNAYDLVPLSYWVDAEMFGAIVVASLPALRQLFTHYRQHRTFRHVKQNSGHTGGRRSFSSSGQAWRTLASSTDTAHSDATAIQPPVNGGIARQTDIDIELDDVQPYQKRPRFGGFDFNGQEGSLDNLRVHAA